MTNEEQQELSMKRSQAIMAVAQAWGIQTHVGLTALVTAIGNIQLLDSKNRDYGTQNIARHGEVGVIVRASDKLARLETLAFSGRAPNHEAVMDSWRDLSLYGLIGQLCNAGAWPGLQPQPQPQVVTMGGPSEAPQPLAPEIVQEVQPAEATPEIVEEPRRKKTHKTRPKRSLNVHPHEG
jgi:hypothetical protein